VKESESGVAVYANDCSNSQQNAVDCRETFLFEIDADAEPDIWGRVAGVFNLANVAPVKATLARPNTDQVRLTVAMQSISATMADFIRRKLLQLTSVNMVKLQASSLHRQEDVSASHE
jgi:hypothetical protein